MRRTEEYLHPGGMEGIWTLGKKWREFRKESPSCLISLCCGTCAGLEYLQEPGLVLYGMDQDPEALKKAADAYPDLILLKGDLEKPLPFQDNQADAILCECCLSLFDNTRLEILKELRRILKPGGFLLVGDLSDRDLKEPEGFSLLWREEQKDWVKQYVAAWLWEHGSFPPWCGCRKKGEPIPGYYLALYKRKEEKWMI